MQERSKRQRTKTKIKSSSLNVLDHPGFLREKQILGDLFADPPIPPIIPVGRTTWWQGVKSGIYPAPIKLSERCTGWKTEDIRKLVERLSSKSDDVEDSDDHPNDGEEDESD